MKRVLDRREQENLFDRICVSIEIDEMNFYFILLIVNVMMFKFFFNKWNEFLFYIDREMWWCLSFQQ